MVIAPERIRELFPGLDTGDGAAFFRHIADNVDWTIMGSHPLAGQYRNKHAFLAGTFAKLNRVFSRGAELFVEHLLVKDRP